MIKLVLDEILAAMEAQPTTRLPPVSIDRISTDSRSVAPGALFFALRGERFDGHDYVGEALAQGALAAVVEHARLPELRRRYSAEMGTTRGLLGVDDPLRALARLAQYHRRQVPAQVIAVVGSNGKTTTKNMIDHVLAGAMKGRASPKSFNNAVGVPLTLLSVESGDEYLVVEIGTNAPGEIAQLAQIAEPEVAIITSIAEEHLEKLVDLAGVAREECSIINHLRAGGVAIVNGDAPYAADLSSASGVRHVTFGRGSHCDLRITDVDQTPAGLTFRVNDHFPYRLPMLGAHNAVNAASAIAVGRRLGMEHDQIAARLATFTAPAMRHELIRAGGVTIINDAYNANPPSAFAAIDTLECFQAEGRKHVVFGEMRELGPRTGELHRSVAERLRQAQFARVLLVGAAADYMAESLQAPGLFNTRVTCVPDVNACVDELMSDLRDGDVVLLKGSRVVGLERLVPLVSARRCSEQPLLAPAG